MSGKEPPSLFDVLSTWVETAVTSGEVSFISSAGRSILLLFKSDFPFVGSLTETGLRGTVPLVPFVDEAWFPLSPPREVALSKSNGLAFTVQGKNRV